MGKIVLMADSVGASANVALAQRWFQMVAIYYGYAAADIINSAVPGDKSSHMLARFAADVLAHNPEVVVFLMGVNDGANGISLATHEANYRSMIEQVMAAGAKVVIITPPIYRQDVASWRPWHAKWLQLAADYGCPLVDVTRAYGWEYVADSAAFNGLYVNSADLVHQSVAGNAKMAAICCEPIHAKSFLKDAPGEQPGGECPECPPAATELQLALSDLLTSGVNSTRLQRVIDAI